MDHVIVIQEQEAWEGTLEVSSCGGTKVPSHLSPEEEENNTPLLAMLWVGSELNQARPTCRVDVQLWALHIPGKRFSAEIHTLALRHRLDG